MVCLSGWCAMSGWSQVNALVQSDELFDTSAQNLAMRCTADAQLALSMDCTDIKNSSSAQGTAGLA